MPMLDGVKILDLVKTMKEIDRVFSSTKDLDERVLYNFFKGEIKPKLAYTDNSTIQKQADEPKRKYAGGFWEAIPDLVKSPRPWVRIGISDELVSSLELIVPERCGKVPKVDLAVDKLGGIGYGFKMGVEYSCHPYLMVDVIVKSVAVEEYRALLKIANKFHKKLKSYTPKH